MRKTISILLTVGFVCSAAAAAEAQRAGRKQTRRAPGRNVMTTRRSIDASLDAYDRERANAQLEREKYKGTTVKPHPSARGELARVQGEAALAIEKADIVPDARTQRFRWIPEQMGTKITGWHAQILETERGPEGLLVKIKVTPLHAGNAGLRTTDYTIETYLVTARSVDHLTTDAPHGRGIITIN